MGLSWMAWTWPTALVFIGIFSAIGTLIVIEIRHPGGDERGQEHRRNVRLLRHHGLERSAVAVGVFTGNLLALDRHFADLALLGLGHELGIA